jgi:hypothetical protein
MGGTYMKITVDLEKGTWTIDDWIFRITCRIRTLKDGTRKRNEVVRSIPDDLPYDPLPFPKGEWKIEAVEWQDKKKFDKNIYGVVKIRTDAWQKVKVWKLDEDGDYLHETEQEIVDRAYLAHYSTSNTTLGCVRFASNEDGEIIGKVIERALEQGEDIDMEVI